LSFERAPPHLFLPCPSTLFDWKCCAHKERGTHRRPEKKAMKIRRRKTRKTNFWSKNTEMVWKDFFHHPFKFLLHPCRKIKKRFIRNVECINVRDTSKRWI
jgi:hypothetical protein